MKRHRFMLKRIAVAGLATSITFPVIVSALVAIAVVTTHVPASAADEDVVAEVTDMRLGDIGLDDHQGSHADSSALVANDGVENLHDRDANLHGDEAKTPILSFDFGSAFWNLVIFVCVLAVLSVFVWPNVLGGLQSREEKIREDLEAAEKANAEAQSILAGYQTKLDEAAVQVQAMLAEARRDAETNGQKIVDQAKAEASSQRQRAVADIENAKKVAMAEIAGKTSEMAMQVARGVVGRELSADDHADLILQAMGRLPSQN